MSSNTAILLGVVVLAGVVLFVVLNKPPERKPGLFEQLGGIADGLGIGGLGALF